MNTALESLDLLAPEAIADPYSFLAETRRRPGLTWSSRHKAWVATRHGDVTALLRDPRLTANRVGTYLRKHGESPGAQAAATFYRVAQEWMSLKEGADHSRLRSLVQRAFSPRVVKDMASLVVELSDEFVDTFPVGEPFDLLERFAFPLPATVIAGMLGVPVEDRDRFKQWSQGLSALVFAASDVADRHESAARATDELSAYIADLIAEREVSPRDDLISHLIEAGSKQDKLTHLEIVAHAILLLFAGHETTTNLICNSVVALLANPSAADALRSGDVDAGMAVEELLRYDSPAKTVIRVALEDVEVAGTRVPEGDRILLIQSAANRDPGVFADPDVLDLTRANAGAHTSFGSGPHYCLGAPLARLEARLALPILLRRTEGLALAGDLSWQPNLLTRGLERLDVTISGLKSKGLSDG
ncbi:cytochrome P450 [Acrocarpospora pleiomorpha]|uniref:Cytochrome P450 n=1 Tax=Acrocarpospora pleiomorpha TaxID=90975 RepID=A0A5M3XJY6_9ACTN|nr:cytochrome P450 [Acrocarpospora pleiomorpha]GES20449.1 cytochrome P450 [Acrocarpospora pleiomorpha]